MKVAFKSPRLSKEVKISFILFLIPLVLVSIVFFPIHEEYVLPGDIVSVQDLGIQGSVNFTYVQSGVTEKLLDKLFLFSEENIEFTPVASYEDYLESEEDLKEYKEETISNAVYYSSNDRDDSEKLESKINRILDQSSNYYGDSLGLMVAIGLVEETNHLDFSRNHSIKIAGTGTINADQTVGEVGAIHQKLLTAEQNKVDYFLIPRNFNKSDGYLSNQEEAMNILKQEKLSIKLVPVATLDEAILFLQNIGDGMKGETWWNYLHYLQGQ